MEGEYSIANDVTEVGCLHSYYIWKQVSQVVTARQVIGTKWWKLEWFVKVWS